MYTKILCTRCYAPTNVTGAAPAVQLHTQVPAHLSGDTSRFIVRGVDRSVHLFEKPARTPTARGPVAQGNAHDSRPVALRIHHFAASTVK